VLTDVEAAALELHLMAGFGVDGARAASLGEAVASVEGQWSAVRAAWLDRICVDDMSAIPANLRVPGSLASFTDECLGDLPFVTRCVPPVTSRRTDPPAPQSGVLEPGPRHISGFFAPGHFRQKADPYFIGMRTHLTDVLANGDAATVPRPKGVTFGQAEFLPKFRNRLYTWSDGHERPTPMLASSDTFAVGYADQEMFSVLDYGVSFKTNDTVEMQLHLPSHMTSIAGGLQKLQRDLAGRVGRGWYDVYDKIPKCPWRPSQAGTWAKRLGGQRLIVNASYPLSSVCDDGGVLIRLPNSASRGTVEELQGSDAARMHRFISRVRATAGSPPPDSETVLPSPDTSPPSRTLGRVTVANASSESFHPFRVYGGRQSWLAMPPDPGTRVPGGSPLLHLHAWRSGGAWAQHTAGVPLRALALPSPQRQARHHHGGQPTRWHGSIAFSFASHGSCASPIQFLRIAWKLCFTYSVALRVCRMGCVFGSGATVSIASS
jgi:hypothetical protein